jgi:hypothetical protein
MDERVRIVRVSGRAVAIGLAVLAAAVILAVVLAGCAARTAVELEPKPFVLSLSSPKHPSVEAGSVVWVPASRLQAPWRQTWVPLPRRRPSPEPDFDR